ncbi:MAG: ribosome-associated translation inhibitor RaiA [Bryobacteraceae bacterium]|jgi:putative sigma-54 modulation protein
MKITYTGKSKALTPVEDRRIEAKFAKLGKLLDAPGGEREAHVILASERRLQRAEIRVHYRDHELFGEAEAADALTAITTALDRLEKQLLKLRAKRRDTKRFSRPEPAGAAVAEAPALARQAQGQATEAGGDEPQPGGPRIFRVDHRQGRKPMTLEEALLVIDGRDYVAYCDAETDRVSVLIRRRDGNFDLIEA